MEPIGVYLHVPFCEGKCPYCDFYSVDVRGQEELLDRYTQALEQEIQRWGERLCRRADTVYFGGGTPALLGAARIGALLGKINRYFPLEQGVEITLEANPTSAQTADYQGLRAAGVNRLSLGLQASGDRELRLLGRGHSTEQAAGCVQSARAAGLCNISLDVMAGLPGQSWETLRETLDFCVRQGVEHVSAYLLKVEEGTPFAARGVARQCPDDDAQAQLYLQMVEYLEQMGYRQYEISNFAASPQWESAHNKKYWRCEEYLGLGPSAHSFLGGQRSYYPRSLQDYLDRAGTPGLLPIPDGPGGDGRERLMLRLRLSEGITLEELGHYFSPEAVATLTYRAKALRLAGLLRDTEDRLALTAQGFLVSNAILVRLLEE